MADVGPQSSVPHALDDLSELGAIGLDDEVDCQAVGGPCLGRPDDGHQGSSGPGQACGPLLDVAANNVEHQIDFADVFEGVVVESDRAQLSEIVQRVRDGRLRTNIDNVSPLDDAVAALNPTKRRKGKTIIRVRP